MSMFKNEAKNILRFLESSYKYVDYFIFQNNGSEDGTQDIIESFLKEKMCLGIFMFWMKVGKALVIIEIICFKLL